MTNYEKSKDFFTKENNDIYLKLKPYLDKGIIHSKDLGEFDMTQPHKALAEMFLFFEDEAFKN